MFELQVRPIDKWPREFTRNRRRGQFTDRYGTIMSDVERELKHLGAKSAVLLMALEDSEIRLDGRPRAGARPAHPGVILVVDTKSKGPLRFPCDAFDHWVANLRAISLHLDALRRIDRYGVSVSGEQYTGWKALPSPTGDHWSREQAAEFLGGLLAARFNLDRLVIAADLLRNRATAENLLRTAEKQTHPDAGGNVDDFKKVQQARKLLLGA